MTYKKMYQYTKLNLFRPELLAFCWLCRVGVDLFHLLFNGRNFNINSTLDILLTHHKRLKISSILICDCNICSASISDENILHVIWYRTAAETKQWRRHWIVEHNDCPHWAGSSTQYQRQQPIYKQNGLTMFYGCRGWSVRTMRRWGRVGLKRFSHMEKIEFQISHKTNNERARVAHVVKIGICSFQIFSLTFFFFYALIHGNGIRHHLKAWNKNG